MSPCSRHNSARIDQPATLVHNWLVPHINEGFGEVADQWFAAGDAVLLGRTTYDLMSSFWPEVTDPDKRRRRYR